MNWVTAIWSILIGCCIAMAVPQLVVGIWQRRIAQLFFVAMSVAVIGVALCELSLMHAESVAEMKRIGVWLQLPLLLLFVANIGFIAFDFRTATLWLGVATCAVTIRFFRWQSNNTDGVPRHYRSPLHGFFG